jgi:transcription termination factor Rho
MSSVLDRDALEESPLADLHVLANQLGIDGYRRMRKADLIDAIVERQGGEAGPSRADTDGQADAAPRRRSRRGGSGRTRKAADADADDNADDETAAAEEAAAAVDDTDEDDREAARSRSRRGGRGRSRRDEDGAGPTAEDKVVEGVVDLQGNGSGFVRVSPPDVSDDDVYVSAAQVKRCELVTGDRIAGPVRAPRRSERYPSLIRIDTINGRPADEVAEGTRFDELPAAFPTERFELGTDDPTVHAVEWLAPFGKGSRVAVSGRALAGKSDLLRRIAGALAGRDGLDITVVLAGVRPEEVGEWGEGIAPAAVVTLGGSADAQGQVVEQVVEQGRRVAARGGDAVVVIDSLDQLPPAVARRALAAARNIADGGSLTVIAAVSEPLGGETTVITLDAALTGLRRFPSLDLAVSGTMRPELLVGEAGAEKIAQARAEALAGR